MTTRKEAIDATPKVRGPRTSSARADFYDAVAIKCPVCGNRLFASKEAVLYCQKALGEVAFDPIRRIRYLPKEAAHRQYQWGPRHNLVVKAVAAWQRIQQEKLAATLATMQAVALVKEKEKTEAA